MSLVPSAGVASETVFRTETLADATGVSGKLALSESVVPPEEFGTV
jgi:hypothetical protein